MPGKGPNSPRLDTAGTHTPKDHMRRSQPWCDLRSNSARVSRLAQLCCTVDIFVNRVILLFAIGDTMCPCRALEPQHARIARLLGGLTIVRRHPRLLLDLFRRI